jgi:hypothetical protein
MRVDRWSRSSRREESGAGLAAPVRDPTRGRLAAADRAGRFVKEFDATTRSEGFHVLNDWDGKADRVNEDTIPVDVLNYGRSPRR